MSASFFDNLSTFGDRVVAHVNGRPVTYRQLAIEADTCAVKLGRGRRLVMVSAGDQWSALVAYVAALRAGHAVLLCSPESTDRLRRIYRPDVVCHWVADGWAIEEQRPGSAHHLHPDLALLLSTSGSTGSPKLVRLSYENLRSNALAIAQYLELTGDDCAATTLPMHYCYGLSVINSHLTVGGSLIINDYSVVDRCFWDEARQFGATSFAGVPYTFELLDRAGFEQMALPSLRYITQAGGRLSADTVRSYAELGRRRGWKLFVMYGQTEATARMAYIPPDMAADNPDCIGVAIPGGHFDLEPLEDTKPDVGELVYRGPNVMLGYATSTVDLALGQTENTLRTGDLARYNSNGLLQIVGRRSRFVKLFGLRIDLDQAEAVLAEEGVRAICTGNDDMLVVATEGNCTHVCVADLVRKHFSLPPASVRVVAFDTLPRLASGKADYVTVERSGRAGHACGALAAKCAKRMDASSAVRQAFRQVLNLRDVKDADTFVSLGGDSMSYVEMSCALENALGHLPADWHTTPVVALEKMVAPRHRWASMDATVVLRALAIVLVVGTHVTLFDLKGGSHLLLVIAGWNYARFALGGGPGSVHAWSQIARVAVPAMVWVGFQTVTTPQYTWANALLVNNYVDIGWWSYWFVEALVQILAVLAVAFAIPAVRRFERHHRFALPAGLLIAGLVMRFHLVHTGAPVERIYTTHIVFWFFVLGWLAHQAVNRRQKIAVAATALVFVPNFFYELERDVLVTGAVLLLLATSSLSVPRWAAPALSSLAGASLFIYLTHYVVYSSLTTVMPKIGAVVACLVVGVLVWKLMLAINSLARRLHSMSSARLERSQVQRVGT